MMKLQPKQVQEIKATLGRDDIENVQIHMNGRDFRLHKKEGPHSLPASATMEELVNSVGTHYYAEELPPPTKTKSIPTGSGLLNQIKLNDRKSHIESVIESIPEMAMDEMIAHANIDDPDFLVEDFDQDTVEIIRAHIREKRNPVAMENIKRYYMAKQFEEEMKRRQLEDGFLEKMKMRFERKKDDSRERFDALLNEEELRRELRRQAESEELMKERREIRMRQYEQEQREKINKLMQIRGSGKGILDQIDAKVSEIDKDLENLYPLPPSKGDAPRNDPPKDVLGGFMDRLRRGKWKW